MSTNYEVDNLHSLQRFRVQPTACTCTDSPQLALAVPTRRALGCAHRRAHTGNAVAVALWVAFALTRD